MRKLIIVALGLTLSACSGGGSSGGSLGRLNPANWFGGGGAVTTQEGQSLAPRDGYSALQDSRPLVDQVVSVRIEPTSTGVIVLAVARTAEPGYRKLALVPATPDRAGQLAFALRGEPPTARTGAGPQDRMVGTFVPRNQLNGIREIRVQAARNSLSARP